MKIFILSKIWENVFINQDNIKEILSYFLIDLNFVKVWAINWYFWDLSNEQFKKILPILNWLVWKYFFYKWDSFKYSLWKNTLDFEFDEKLILKSSWDILEINNFLNSNNLLTNSKKEDFSKSILDSLYNIWWFLIKTYFMMDEIIENKNDLQKIIDDKEIFYEYKSQALLLDSVAFDKLDLIKTRFDMLNLQLNSFADILNKYFKNYVL